MTGQEGDAAGLGGDAAGDGMVEYPFAVGAKVSGVDAGGAPFSAKVIRADSPFSVLLDDGYWTPVSLIREVVATAAEPAAPAPTMPAQGSLF